MMNDRISYWKCPKCHGTGRVFSPWYAKTSQECFDCAGSGNAFVSGEEERHRRRLADELKSCTSFGGN